MTFLTEKFVFFGRIHCNPLYSLNVFFLLFSSLRLDYVLNSIALGLVALEVFISMVFVINFYQQKLNRFDV